MRYCKQNAQRITATNIAQSLEKKNNKQFWKQIKKVSGTVPHCPSVIDSCNTADEICDLFHKKFSDLYTSVSYEQYEMDTLKNDINNRIYCMGKEKTMKSAVSVDEITKLAKMLKHYKDDGSKLRSSF